MRRRASRRESAPSVGYRRSRHRQYGLSNANQVLLVTVVTALLFFALLRWHWLEFDHKISAGLWGILVPADVNRSANDSSASVSWREFCKPDTPQSFTLPLLDGVSQPINVEDAMVLCGIHEDSAAYLTEVIRALVATAIGFTATTLVCAVYLHVGHPSRKQIHYLGAVPGLALLIAAILGTIVLILWQSNFRAFDNGDCFTLTVAATTIAYLTAISMMIRWRWPGICAVPNEQQAFRGRSYRFAARQQQQPGGAGATAQASSPHLDTILVDATQPPPRVGTFHQMVG
uniref:Uncharacterized protein n=1 Tax=Globisporangium ultimum (strain ATCC 200006 / CBS 805.95 / DAOM BR144) TaxID=431595 RepID=K3WKL4_GLOUD